MGQLMRAIQGRRRAGDLRAVTTLGTMAPRRGGVPLRLREGRAVPLSRRPASRPRDRLNNRPFRLDGRVAFVDRRGRRPRRGDLHLAGRRRRGGRRGPRRSRTAPRRSPGGSRTGGGSSLALQVDVTDSGRRGSGRPADARRARRRRRARQQRRDLPAPGVDGDHSRTNGIACWGSNLKAYFLCARACHSLDGGPRPRPHRQRLVGHVPDRLRHAARLRLVEGRRRRASPGRWRTRSGPTGSPSTQSRRGPSRPTRRRSTPDPEGLQRAGCSSSSACSGAARPDDIGNLVVFLAERRVASFITGQTVAIDGGWAMH